jgi:uncharacterized protein YehS (DUF1456 family)
MTNNDILRRLRYSFDFNDFDMIDIFALAEYEVERSKVNNWLKPDEHEEYVNMPDKQLAIFLNGLIYKNRGKQEGKPLFKPESKMDNNLVLKKLKIALELRTDEIVSMFQLIDKEITVNELSAFLRNPKQKQYRPCKDQYLRNFLSSVQKAYRGDSMMDD